VLPLALALADEPAGIDREAPWRWIASDAGGRAGSSVALGDCNGDGFDDLAVGAPEAPRGGRVYLFNGSSAGLPASPTATVEAEEGNALAFADVDADGDEDLVVGTSGRASGRRGRASLYTCSPGGIAEPAAWRVFGRDERSRLGAWVIDAGDFNADGYRDVAVSDRARPHARGGLQVYFGSAAGLDRAPGWRPGGVDTSPVLGLGGGVDVTGDGVADLASSNGTSVFLWAGAAGVPAAEPLASFSGADGSRDFGDRLALGPDLDGDGDGELVVYDRAGGRPAHGGAWGSVWVFAGAPGGPDLTPDKITSTSSRPAQGIAWGDLNGDGVDDLLLGASKAHIRSRVMGVLGGPGQLTREGWGAWNAWADIEGDNELGHAVATGDVNGDGLVDVAAGDPHAPGDGGPLAGAVYLWLGTQAPGSGDIDDDDAPSGVDPPALLCNCASASPGSGVPLLLALLAARRRRDSDERRPAHRGDRGRGPQVADAPGSLARALDRYPLDAALAHLPLALGAAHVGDARDATLRTAGRLGVVPAYLQPGGASHARREDRRPRPGLGYLDDPARESPDPRHLPRGHPRPGDISPS